MPSPYIRQATRENFAGLVVANSHMGPVLVDFHAPSAGPSQRQRLLFEKLADAYAGRLLLVVVDVERERMLAHEQGVTSVPGAALWRNGAVVAQFHSLRFEDDYRQAIDRALGTPTSIVEQEAIACFQRGEADEALDLLARATVADPANPRLPLLMAKILIRAGRSDDALRLLDALPAALARDDELGRFREQLRLARDPDPAPENPASAPPS